MLKIKQCDWNRQSRAETFLIYKVIWKKSSAADWKNTEIPKVVLK